MSTAKWMLGPGEYNNWVINPKDNQVYDISATPVAKVAGQPTIVTGVVGCLHHQVIIDNQGNLYMWGQSAAGETGQPTTTTAFPTLIAKDVNGNPFGQVIEAIPYCNGVGGNGVLIRDIYGTVWIMGNTQTGMRGDGSAGNFNDGAPVQVSIPAPITQICAGIYCAALDINGNIWTWGADAPGQYWKTYVLGRGVDNPDATRPEMMVLPSPAASICAGGFFNYAILKNGSVIGWAYYPEYLTGSPITSAPVSASNTPVVLDKVLNLPAAIVKIAMSTVATYAILSNGSLYAWGDNACGACGNGKEINFATYEAPYAWDWGRMELPQSPVQIGAGLSFANVTAGLGDVFYAIAEDVNGNLYSWGRNKGGVLGNGQIGSSSDQSAYPNSWDVPAVTPINPFTLTAPVYTPSPANMGGTLIPSGVLTCSVSVAQPITGTSGLLQGHSNGTINYWSWKQLSGPNQALIILPTSQSPTIQGLVPGTYTFQLTVKDNNWRIANATALVNVIGGITNVARTVVSFSSKLVNGTWQNSFVFSDGTTQ